VTHDTPPLLAELPGLPWQQRPQAAYSDEILAYAAGLDPASDAYRLLCATMRAASVYSRSWEAAVKDRRPRGTADRLDWRHKLARGEGGIPTATPANLGLILRQWAPFESVRLNGLTLEAEIAGQAFKPGDNFRWREQVEKTFGTVFTAELMTSGLEAIAEEREYHPVVDYLNGLTWDGEERLWRVSSDMLDAGDDPLHRRMVECFFVGAVNRMYRPGSQHDSVLVLFDPHGGVKKTTFFRTVARGWAAAGDIDPRDRDTYLKAHQQWIQIFDEIDDLTTSYEWPAMRRWITELDDVFRAPYARMPKRHLRRFLFAGTTNKHELLPARDSASSRRFHVLRVGPKDPYERIATVKSVLDQLWAEARDKWLKATDQGRSEIKDFTHWLDPTEETRREAGARRYQEQSILDERVEGYIRDKAGADITMDKLLMGALGVPWDQVTKAVKEARASGAILRRQGYEKHDTGSGTVWRKG